MTPLQLLRLSKHVTECAVLFFVVAVIAALGGYDKGSDDDE